MDDFLYVKNWEQFQQYRDRDPKWIKLHRDTLDDYEFDGLTEIQQCHLIKIWLLAAKLGNKIPNDTKWVARKIGAQSKVDLDQLVTVGFLVSEKSVQMCTDVYTEREGEGEEERETEVETEKRERGATPKPKKNEVHRPDDIDEQVWSDFLSHRRQKQAKLNPTAWGRIRNQLDLGIARGHDPNDMLAEAMEAGWRGFKFDWYLNRVGSQAKPRISDDYSQKRYEGTPDDELPDSLR